MPPGNNKNLAACRENNRNITENQIAIAPKVSLPPRISARHCTSRPSNGGVSESPTLYNSPEMMTSVNFS